MFNKVLQTYKDEGVFSVIEGGWDLLLVGSRLSPYIKLVLGERLHQKFYAYPHLRYWPDIKNPRTFNEHILHRKIYTHDEFFSLVEDKLRVREFVENNSYSEILPTIHYTTSRPEDLTLDILPKKCVIKPNHMSGSVLFIDDKEKININEIRAQCQTWLEQEYGVEMGEYWYEEIEPKIIVEEYLEGEDGNPPRDYKFFVFNGSVEFIQVDYDRFSGHKRRFYDRDWNPQEFSQKYPLGPTTERPENLPEMIKIAERLGEQFDFIRVDLYIVDEEIVFGELTVGHESGVGRFEPSSIDYELGQLWDE